MVNPVIGAALISGAGGLLSGLFGGMAKKGQQEQAFELEKRMLELQRKYQLEDRDWKMKQMEPFKPKTPYYEGYKDLPGFDLMMKQFVLGRMQDMFGENLSRYGIDIGGLTASLGQPQAGDTSRGGPSPVDQVINRRGLGARSPGYSPRFGDDRRGRRGYQSRDEYGE